MAMRWGRRAWLVGVLGVVLACGSAGAQTPSSDWFWARVVSVSDGDTLRVDAGDGPTVVRLSGIDAPERRQAFGRRSRDHLAALLGPEVLVSPRKRDRYGRLVAQVFASGQDVGLRQIEAGLAWHYTAYRREQPAEEALRYAEAEQSARDRRAGLWAEAQPQPPWEYRRRR